MFVLEIEDEKPTRRFEGTSRCSTHRRETPTRAATVARTVPPAGPVVAQGAERSSNTRPG